jgi:hypothetical protein
MRVMRGLVRDETAIDQIETQEIPLTTTSCDDFPLTQKPISPILTPSKSGLYPQDHWRILVLYAFGNE